VCQLAQRGIVIPGAAQRSNQIGEPGGITDCRRDGGPVKVGAEADPVNPDSLD
jgi:hypothetical protein